MYQSAGKVFADPKACVGPLSAELVTSLFASSGGGDHIGGNGLHSSPSQLNLSRF